MTIKEHVILLHGVWMRGFSLLALRRRLETAGFTTELFEYASVVRGPEPGIVRLIERVQKAQAPRVHLVGHSLGGLIALQAVRRATDLQPGHVVCLGSPLNGSAVAGRVARLPGGALVLGRSLELLRDGLDCWDGRRPVGVIAGSLPIGIGQVFGTLPERNDGTVGVEETRLAGITEHRELPVTHTGLLFSAAAARMTAAFLHSATFAGADGV